MHSNEKGKNNLDLASGTTSINDISIGKVKMTDKVVEKEDNSKHKEFIEKISKNSKPSKSVIQKQSWLKQVKVKSNEKEPTINAGQVNKKGDNVILDEEIAVAEMVEEIMPETSFKMTVDPGDELDFSYEEEEADEVDSSSEEEGEVRTSYEVQREQNLSLARDQRQVRDNQVRDSKVNKDELSRLKNNPEVKKFLELMNGQVLEKNELKKDRQETRPDTNRNASRESRGMKGVKRKWKPNQCSTPKIKPAIVKSPSDTTIYTPALKQKRFSNNISKNSDHFDDVAKAVHDIRLNDFPGDRPGTSGLQQQDSQDLQRSYDRQTNRSRQMANDVILHAERQKAAIAAPTGNLQIPLFCNFDNKDAIKGRQSRNTNFVSTKSRPKF